MYMLEVPKNCDVVGILRRGDKYPAEIAEGFLPDENYRIFYFTANNGLKYFAREFSSHHLSGGSWIVHEEEEE